jgi:hypothetical protein
MLHQNITCFLVFERGGSQKCKNFLLFDAKFEGKFNRFEPKEEVPNGDERRSCLQKIRQIEKT